MFDRHQTEITVTQVTLFRWSVYECTMGFYLVPFRQQSPPSRFLLITGIGMCHFLPVHHFGMACLAGSKVNIQQIMLLEEFRFVFKADFHGPKITNPIFFVVFCFLQHYFRHCQQKLPNNLRYKNIIELLMIQNNYSWWFVSER